MSRNRHNRPAHNPGVNAQFFEVRAAWLPALAGVLMAGAAARAQVINEFVFNHDGADTNEYVEIFGAPSTSYINLWLLQIEGEGAGAGSVDSAIQLGSTDVNGFWWTGYRDSVFENGTLTLLLVSNWSGVIGSDIDNVNGGTITSTFWDSIIDSVGIFDGGASEFVYSSVSLSTNLAPAGFAVGGASRIPNGVDTDSVSDWARNDFDRAGIPGFSGTLDTASGEVLNTPNALNAIPEPGTVLLFGLGLGLVGGTLRRPNAGN